jgi:polysaccharide biosynthesis transport protein
MFDEMQNQNTRTTEDYWAMIRRQRWVILASIFICWLLVWGIGWLVPSKYESVAVVNVQPQQVSPNLIEPDSMETPETQLANVINNVLTRSQLQGIIDQYHLYPKHTGWRELLDPADPVEQMAIKDIQVMPLERPGQRNSNKVTLTAFELSYVGPTPELAQSVNQKLMDLFLEQNNKQQQTFSQETTQFLKNQLDDAKNQLDQQDAQMKAFKAKHMGELPDQEQGNLQILSGLQQQLQNNANALSAAEQQKLYLQSIVQQYQSAQSDLGASDSTVTPSSLDKQLKDLEMELAQERSQYTDNYPDVIALKEQIEKTKELKKQTEAQIADEHKSDKGSTGEMPAGAATDVQNGAPTPMMQIQSQLKSNQLQIQSLAMAQKKIQTQIADYQARLNAAPEVDQELSGISRGYTEAVNNYNTLRQKWQNSQLAGDLPGDQQGSYSIGSAATLPNAPAAPNHLLISLAGLALGIVVGIGLAALLELTDVRIRKEGDLEGIVSARVLVGIPNMTTPAEDRRRAMLRWAERGAVFAMLVIVVLGNIYAFYKG